MPGGWWGVGVSKWPIVGWRENWIKRELGENGQWSLIKWQTNMLTDISLVEKTNWVYDWMNENYRSWVMQVYDPSAIYDSAAVLNFCCMTERLNNFLFQKVIWQIDRLTARQADWRNEVVPLLFFQVLIKKNMIIIWISGKKCQLFEFTLVRHVL